MNTLKDIMIETLPVHHHTRVISLLKNGEVVAFPTATSYGLGVNVLEQEAVNRLDELKNRPPDKTYSILLPEENKGNYVSLKNEEKAALSAFSDVPLTILVEAGKKITHMTKDNKVGVRTADHPFTKELMKLIDFPITATSANPSGKPAAYSVKEIREYFPEASFKAVDGGTLPHKKPSTVAAWNGKDWKVYREGEVSKKDLNKATGQEEEENEGGLLQRR